MSFTKHMTLGCCCLAFLRPIFSDSSLWNPRHWKNLTSAPWLMIVQAQMLMDVISWGSHTTPHTHTPDISIFSLTDRAPERNKSWHGIILHFLSCQPFFEVFFCVFPLVTFANNHLRLLLFARTIKWVNGVYRRCCWQGWRRMFVNRLHYDMKYSHWSHWCFINTPRDCVFAGICVFPHAAHEKNSPIKNSEVSFLFCLPLNATKSYILGL